VLSSILVVEPKRIGLREDGMRICVATAISLAAIMIEGMKTV
jgi:hypothetical protein